MLRYGVVRCYFISSKEGIKKVEELLVVSYHRYLQVSTLLISGSSGGGVGRAILWTCTERYIRVH